MPDWVKTTVDMWTEAASLSEGRLFRCVCRVGKCWGDGVTERAVVDFNPPSTEFQIPFRVKLEQTGIDTYESVAVWVWGFKTGEIKG